jgi:hypothetical protein
MLVMNYKDNKITKYLEKKIKRKEFELGVIYFTTKEAKDNILIFDIYNPLDYELLFPFKGKILGIYYNVTKQGLFTYYIFYPYNKTVKQEIFDGIIENENIEIYYGKPILSKNLFYEEKRMIILWNFK